MSVRESEGGSGHDRMTTNLNCNAGDSIAGQQLVCEVDPPGLVSSCRSYMKIGRLSTDNPPAARLRAATTVGSKSRGSGVMEPQATAEQSSTQKQAAARRRLQRFRAARGLRGAEICSDALRRTRVMLKSTQSLFVIRAMLTRDARFRRRRRGCSRRPGEHGSGGGKRTAPFSCMALFHCLTTNTTD